MPSSNMFDSSFMSWQLFGTEIAFKFSIGHIVIGISISILSPFGYCCIIICLVMNISKTKFVKFFRMHRSDMSFQITFVIKTLAAVLTDQENIVFMNDLMVFSFCFIWKASLAISTLKISMIHHSHLWASFSLDYFLFPFFFLIPIIFFIQLSFLTNILFPIILIT